MDILLWVLQVLAALLYGVSGVMKALMFPTSRCRFRPNRQRRSKHRRQSHRPPPCRQLAVVGRLVGRHPGGE